VPTTEFIVTVEIRWVIVGEELARWEITYWPEVLHRNLMHISTMIRVWVFELAGEDTSSVEQLL
jgi:hypothetical protein